MNIGIFITDFSSLEPRKKESIFKKLIFISKHLDCNCFLFTYKDINFQKGFIWGNTLKGDSFLESKWVYKMFPVPDIVYIQFDSLVNDIKERATASLRLLTKINPLIKLFNATNFDKLEVYKMLFEDKNIRKFLPVTEPFYPENIIKFIKKHKVIYLKPTNLSLGMGISRISFINNEYIQDYNDANNTPRKKFFSNSEELKKEIVNFIGNQEYIVQKGIDLFTQKNKAIVFRSHLFKNGNGKWDVVGLNARVTGKHAFITGRRYGGYFTSSKEVLNVFFGLKAESLYNKMKATSLLIANFLTEKYPGILGEVGFDLGIDKSGSIWLIEANFKPNWTVFYDFPEYQKKIMVNFFAYCKYLYTNYS